MPKFYFQYGAGHTVEINDRLKLSVISALYEEAIKLRDQADETGDLRVAYTLRDMAQQYDKLGLDMQQEL